MLMNDKIMFDRYYCINSKKPHRKLRNVCALYSSALPPFFYARTLFINILDSGRGQVLYPHDDLKALHVLCVVARRVYYKYNSVAGL